MNNNQNKQFTALSFAFTKYKYVKTTARKSVIKIIS